MSPRPRHRSTRPIVALIWDRQELLAAIAKSTVQGLKLIDTLHVPIEPPDSLATAASTLAEQLRERRITSYHLLVGLPRSQVEMLTFPLPPATMAELPEMVRHEVMRQLPDLPEESVIDFWLPDGDQHGASLTVEAAALRGESQEAINTVSEQLQQRPAQIVVRSLAIASLFVRQIKKIPEHSLLLNLLKSTADVSVLSGRRITFTRSVHLAETRDEHPDVGHLADEIRRTLFVAPREPATAEGGAGDEVQHVYMFANLDRNSPLVEQLADDLQLTVSLLDPLAGIELPPGGRPEQTHRYAVLIGMIRDFCEGTTTLDLANPKQPPPPPRLGRKLAMYAAAGLAALAIVSAVLQRDVAQVREAAEVLAADVDGNRQLLKKLQGKTIVLDAVQRWEQTEINWLDELRRLSDRFPPPDQAVVQRISMAPTNASRGIISMSVRVQDPAIIAELEQNLRDEAHQVSSQRISQADSAQEFATQFETSLIVTPRAAIPRPLAANPPADR